MALATAATIGPTIRKCTESPKSRKCTSLGQDYAVHAVRKCTEPQRVQRGLYSVAMATVVPACVWTSPPCNGLRFGMHRIAQDGKCTCLGRDYAVPEVQNALNRREFSEGCTPSQWRQSFQHASGRARHATGSRLALMYRSYVDSLCRGGYRWFRAGNAAGAGFPPDHLQRQR
jgi:hypothetical protein